MDKKYIRYGQKDHADLPSLLEMMSSGDQSASLRERLNTVYLLVDWIFSDHRFSRLRFHRKENVRIKFLAQLLERNSDLRENFLKTLRPLFIQLLTYEYFSFYAMPDYDDFLSESTRRLWRIFFPSLPQSAHLGEVITYLEGKLEHSSDVRKRKMAKDFDPLLDIFLGDPTFKSQIKMQLRSVLRSSQFVLVGQTASLALSGDLRTVLAGSELERSIFELQQNQIWDDEVTVGRIIDLVTEFRRSGRHQGITINAEFKLYKIQLFLQRLIWVSQMVRAFVTRDSTPDLLALTSLRSRHKNNQMWTLLQESLQVLALKVIDTSAETGEHYIARDHRENLQLTWSAIKGGVVTVATVVGKSMLSLIMVGFWLGIFQSINYAVSFVIIQLCGGSLATKQPATTAARLAQRFELYLNDQGVGARTGDRKIIRHEIYYLIRSQIFSVFGNLLGVIPVAYGMGVIFEQIAGHPLFTPQMSEHYFHDFSALGPTPLFAAFTGILLWISSLIGGWIQSVLAFHRVFASLEWNRTLRRIVGKQPLIRSLGWLAPKMPCLLSNVTLGFLLGLVPILLSFFGIPLEVRHVTLSTGTLAFAVQASGWHSLETSQFLYAALGILAMGFMNILVSFACSIVTAFTASNLKLSQLSDIFLRGHGRGTNLADHGAEGNPHG